MICKLVGCVLVRDAHSLSVLTVDLFFILADPVKTLKEIRAPSKVALIEIWDGLCRLVNFVAILQLVIVEQFFDFVQSFVIVDTISDELPTSSQHYFIQLVSGFA